MSFITDRVKYYLEIAAVVALAALLWWTYNWIFERGAAENEAKWQAVELVRAEALRVQVAKAHTTELELQAQADNNRRTTNAQITALTGRLAVALDSLRDRPERPSGTDLSKVAGPRPSCTGAELYRDDGQLLEREAARAEILQLALGTCQTQYNANRDAAEALAPKPTE